MKIKFIYLLCLFTLIACNEEKQDQVQSSIKSQELHITCDLEKTEGVKFIGEGGNLGHANMQTDAESRSGKYSVAVSSEHQYAAEYVFGKLKKGTQIEALVWRKAKNNIGAIVIQDIKGNIFWANSTPVKRDGDWEMIYIEKTLPVDVEEIKVFLFNKEDEVAYFDDIEIWVNDSKALPEFKDIMDIKISKKEWAKIEKYRLKALDKKQITKGLKKYVDGEIVYKGEHIPVELRLKGDWTDHLNTNKWSFRIKVKGDKVFNGMKTFSVQSPHTRDFMNEWFMHKLFQKEGVLSTRYDFVPVRINGELMGLYACEEHFTKQLPEQQSRREGPVLKFDEEGFWQSMQIAKQIETLRVPYYEESEVVAFSQNKTIKTPHLKAHFNVGKDLLTSYKLFSGKMSDIFDLDYTARFLALFDIGNSFHGLAWHNQRFYYNPVNAKLEQVGYDCFEETGHHKERRAILGIFSDSAAFNIDWYLNYQLMDDPEFMELYGYYLSKYSDPAYLNEVFESLNPEMDELEALLKAEYRLYSFDKEFFRINARKIKKILDVKKPKAKTRYYRPKTPVYNEPDNEDGFVKDISVQAYIQDTVNDQIKLKVLNFHTSDVCITGYTLSKKRDNLISLDTIVLSKYRDKVDTKEILVPLNTRRLFFTAANTKEELHDIKIFKWSEPKSTSVHETFREYALTPKEAGMVLNGKIWTFKAGAIQLKKPVLIPKGYTVNIEGGAVIDLINGASIVSYSPIKTIEGIHPILIRSSDSTGQGVLVLDASEKSVLHRVEFENLSNFSFQGWSQTGAVTFYNTSVDIQMCYFNNNRCEDGLNLVRCQFSMENVSFSNTYADAFDADFCAGKLMGCDFVDVGNDAIDVSGSTIEIASCKVDNAGDKAVSGGEGSTVVANRLELIKCNIAVASKDASNVDVKMSRIQDCNVAYAVYQKKPEFGAAHMTVENVELIGVHQRTLIDYQSTLNGDYTIKGTSRINVDSLYAEPTAIK